MLDGSLTAVIGGNRQQPVAVELIVQRLQIIERRARRLDDVAPSVVPPVLLEVEARPRAGDELPQSRRARSRVGVRLVRALNHRQQGKLERHAALFDLRGNVIEIKLRALEGSL